VFRYLAPDGRPQAVGELVTWPRVGSDRLAGLQEQVVPPG
jgi:hypothetical protein